MATTLLQAGKHDPLRKRWSPIDEASTSPDSLNEGGADCTESILLAGNSQLLNIDFRQGKVIWQLAHEGGGTRGSYSMIPVPAGPGGLLLAHLDDQSKFLTLDGAAQPGSTAWQSRALRNSYASAVFDKGHFYAYSSRFLTCVEATSGEVRWRSREAGRMRMK